MTINECEYVFGRRTSQSGCCFVHNSSNLTCQSSAVTGHPWRCCCVEGRRWLADVHDGSTTCNVQRCISATLESLVCTWQCQGKEFGPIPFVDLFEYSKLLFMSHAIRAFKSPSYHAARKQELCSLNNINLMASSAKILHSKPLHCDMGNRERQNSWVPSARLRVREFWGRRPDWGIPQRLRTGGQFIQKLAFMTRLKETRTVMEHSPWQLLKSKS